MQTKVSLGNPFSETQSATSCIASRPGELTIAWRRRLPYAQWFKACVTLDYARVTGKSWRTDRGLRVGSSEATIQKLYPSASKKGSGSYTVWRLASASKITLEAWSKQGKVAYFWVG